MFKKETLKVGHALCMLNVVESYILDCIKESDKLEYKELYRDIQRIGIELQELEESSLTKV